VRERFVVSIHVSIVSHIEKKNKEIEWLIYLNGLKPISLSFWARVVSKYLY
jgi:hypothetical protein